MARRSRGDGQGGGAAGNIEFYLGWLLGLVTLLAYYFIPGREVEPVCDTAPPPAIEQPAVVEGDGEAEAEEAVPDEPTEEAAQSEDEGGFLDRVRGMFRGGADAPAEPADAAVSEAADVVEATPEAVETDSVPEPEPVSSDAEPEPEADAQLDAGVVEDAAEPAVEALAAGEALVDDAAEAVEEASDDAVEAAENVDESALEAADEEPPIEEAVVTPPADGERIGPPFAGLSTNQQVVELIKEHEGLRLESYQGPSGKWLIGYGHGGDEVGAGQSVTEAEAETLLVEDLATIEEVIKGAVTVPMNSNELSAMVDLAYNIGSGSFRTSSVLRSLNEGDRAAAADAFLLWNKVTVNGVQTASEPLTVRRELERAIFLGEPTE